MSIYTKIIAREKLQEAWKRVRRNKPAAGVDGITYEDFEADLKGNIGQLYLELEAHTYESLPVKIVYLYKGEKKREVSLYSMRDKVVQQAIAAELGKLFDHTFSDAAYAYRPGKAALEAVGFLEKELGRPEHKWILKADIKSFFDTVSLGRLYGMLEKTIREEDVMDLIKACCEAPELKKDGTLEPKRLGIYQGSGIAPILSNVYLREFDREMEKKCRVYVRYSDDILILGESKEEMEQIRDFMQLQLERLGLLLSAEKTRICSADEGVDFLGYRLTSNGNMIPAKAERNLQERLEEIWIGDMPLAEKLQKGSEVLNGWEQYYRKDREIASIEEFAVVIHMVRQKDEQAFESIRAERIRFKNLYLDICRFLCEVWQNPADRRFEYEQYYELDELDRDVQLECSEALCEVFRENVTRETEENWSSLMQLYADAGAYNKAAKAAEHKERLAKAEASGYTPAVRLREQESLTETDQVFADAAAKPAFVQAFLQTFGGREDTYGSEEFNTKRKRCVEQVSEPLLEEVVQAHLRGEQTIATYLQRTNQTVRYLVIDVDISKKFLIQDGEAGALERYLPEAAQTAGGILKQLKRLGLQGYPEFSGYRGYHVWVFFTEWIPTRYVNMLTDVIEDGLKEKPACVSVEFFPNKSRMKAGATGQAIKLPYGIHIQSGRRSMLLTEDFQEIEPDREQLLSIAQFSPQAIKRVIGAHTKQEEEIRTREVEADLAGFGEIPDSIRVILQNCSLMRYLCRKAMTTGYLTHFERLSVLYVFGHIGDPGKAFVHTVMEFTLNYKYHVTDKFIQRIPEKPVSCGKLREQYKQITAEYGCSCRFKRAKNCYPSPVLHALESGDDLEEDITIPTSRTMSREKQKAVVEEMNVHKKVQELAGRIVEMKKQKRGIDKSIRKVELEMERIFDQAGCDCMEVDMGLLVRRKTADGYEWLIEI